jgi:hypothetical protein
MQTNPFPLKGYVSKDLFCDRESELNQLFINQQNGVDTTLISPRRMGKTGLIHRLFDYIDQESKGKKPILIFVDIFPSRNLEDFIKLLAEAILTQIPVQSTIGERFMHFIKSLRPTFTYDPLTGQPQLQLFYQSEADKAHTLLSLFSFLDQQGKNVLLAVDEFQQINNYPEQQTEALLRTHIQSLKHTHFIFSGSKRSLMVDLFSNAKRPFYASTQFLELAPIPTATYEVFIKNNFMRYQRTINEEALRAIMTWSKGYTYYTQCLCNALFASGATIIDINQVNKASNDLLARQEPVFLQYRSLLTSAQWNYLIAVAKEQVVRQITSQTFLRTHGIGTPANSTRLAKSLLEKDLLLETITKEGKSIQVYDVFFSRWLEQTY